MLHVAQSILVAYDTSKGGTGEYLNPDAGYLGPTSRQLALVLKGAMQESPSMYSLFALKSYAAGFVGEESQMFNVIVNVKALEIGNYEAEVNGMVYKAVDMGSIGEALISKANLLAADLFVDSEDLLGIEAFLDGRVRYDVIDLDGHACLGFQYTFEDAGLVTSQSVGTGLAQRLSSLSVRDMKVFEQKYYDLLNIVQAAIGLLSPNRAPEIGNCQFRNSAGGG